MPRPSRARRIVAAGVLSTASMGVVAATFAGIVYSETKLARRRIRPTETPPPVADGVWSAPEADPARTSIRLAVIGDSSAAGYGLLDAAQTPAAVLARGLSAWSRRPVDVRCVAVVGAQSADLHEQVERVRAYTPDVAFVMIGANDVTHRIRPAAAVRELSKAVTELRESGCEVVVGTCPDLGTIRLIAQPLRFIARRISRALAAAQTVAVVNAGGRSVSLGDVLGPRFAAERDLFADDEFHPSARGYAAAIEVTLPSVAAALGLETCTEAAGPFLSRRARPVASAAAHAADHPGTEVSGTSVHGLDSGRRGRWARLLRRGASESEPPGGEGGVGSVRQHAMTP